MTTATQPIFPQELLDSFIDAIAAEGWCPVAIQQTLRSLALVSLPCYITARKHLFSRIKLDLSVRYIHNRSTPVSTLMKVLQANEYDIRAAPRSLEVTVNPYNIENPDLSLILGWLRHLEELKANFMGTSWEVLRTGNRMAAFRNLPETSPQVKTLELRNINHLDAGFLLRWKNVVDLTVDGGSIVNAVRTRPHDNVKQLQPLPWKHLYLGGGSHLLKCAFGIFLPAPNLRSLEIHLRVTEAVGDVWPYLSSPAAQTLESLKISTSGHSLDPPAGTVVNLPRLRAFEIYANDAWDYGDKVVFKEVLALAYRTLQLETIKLFFQVVIYGGEELSDPNPRIHERAGWHQLDCAFAGPAFPSLKEIEVELFFSIFYDGFECREARNDHERKAEGIEMLYAESNLFPRCTAESSPRKLKVEVETYVGWRE